MEREEEEGGGRGRNNENYGTEKMEELPDRLQVMDSRGPDHPHVVGTAPAKGNATVMGKRSTSHTVLGMGQRGQRMTGGNEKKGGRGRAQRQQWGGGEGQGEGQGERPPRPTEVRTRKQTQTLKGGCRGPLRNPSLIRCYGPMNLVRNFRGYILA